VTPWATKIRFLPDDPQPGPKLAASPTGLSAATDDLTQALDPTGAGKVEIGCGQGRGQADRRGPMRVAAANDSIRAMMLIRTYRVRGHLAANLDPLGLSQQELPPT
jgi:2-oxoglutarate dehydrogenase E1 component